VTDESIGESTDDVTDDPTDEAGSVATLPESEFERAVGDGITFEYPTSLFSGFRHRAGTGAETASPPSVVIDLALVGGATPESEIVITTIRDRRGSFLSTTADADRAAALAIESDAERSGDERLSFVNGRGTRRVDDGAYVFSGITTDGAQIVEFRSVVESLAVARAGSIALLDALVGSIFIDGGSTVLAVDECADAVDVLSEVEIEGGGEVERGSLLTASWSVRNAGTCAWSESDAWVFSGGDSVTVVDISPVEALEPGDVAVVVVTLQAPTSPGAYAVQFQLMPAGRMEVLEPPVPVAFEVVIR
jgi:hypothetical protein